MNFQDHNPHHGPRPVYIPLETIESIRRPTNRSPSKEELEDDCTIGHIFCYVVALLSIVYVIGCHVKTYFNGCDPKINIKSFSLTSSDVQNSEISVGCNIVFNFKNPTNYSNMFWENSLISVSYVHQLLGATVINSFYQKPKDHTLIEATIPSSKIKLDPWVTRGISIDKARDGGIDFRINMEGKMWCDQGYDGNAGYKYLVTADCLVTVEFPMNSTVGSSRGLGPCYVQAKIQAN